MGTRYAHAGRRGPRRGCVGALAALLALVIAVPLPAAERASVAVAASLRIAMPALIAAFERETGHSLRVAYASSGILTRQIRRGAPFSLFLAANADYPGKLVRAGLTVGAGTTYAHGRIGLFVPDGSPLDADAGLEGLRRALANGRVERFAIPHPGHAPYGVRARQALEHAGLWQRIQPVLVRGENAAQAAQFSASGSTAGGIIPASLGRAPRFAERGRFAPIAARRHAPLEQRMVLLAGADATARSFYRFMQGPVARRILERNGFALPAADASP